MKCFTWRVIAASTAAALMIGQTVAPNTGVASVKVVVLDTFGHPVPGARITVTSVGPNEKFAAVGGEAQFNRIAFGLYDLEVRLAGFLR
ncbi:MAG: carboxypeptidase-like regulatory domain-containing protein, partial [Acidobacteriota bacterium]|nr:carboxypeptidase-like regulatory domain-containing protein [Acidobacteriota bacterium]